MSAPRGQHLEPLPGMPRHLPHETARYRADEGCWCSVTYYQGDALPTARQWRARRRRTARSWRRWDLREKRHGIPPQHNHRFALRGIFEPVPPCPPGCPVPPGFNYARDWPPTVTSWKGLL